MCKASHAEERAAFHFAPRHQLRFASAASAKSIAFCKLHPPENLLKKIAWWAAMWHVGFAPKVLTSPLF